MERPIAFIAAVLFTYAAGMWSPEPPHSSELSIVNADGQRPRLTLRDLGCGLYNMLRPTPQRFGA